jgi:hypothetical protein
VWQTELNQERLMDFAQFTFKTDGFQDTAEALAENVNGFAGRELAVWLARELKARGLDASEVWPEDHGWDFSVAHAGAKYVCACLIEDADAGREGSAIVNKARSMMDKLLGRNTMAADDPVAGALRAALASSPTIRDLEAQ